MRQFHLAVFLVFASFGILSPSLRADGVLIGFGFESGRDHQRHPGCTDGCGSSPCRGGRPRGRRGEGVGIQFGGSGFSVEGNGFSITFGGRSGDRRARPEQPRGFQPGAYQVPGCADPACDGDHGPQYGFDIDDGKKRVVKKALLVGVGWEEHDRKTSEASIAALHGFVGGEWGFKCTRIINDAGTKEQIVESLDDLVKNAVAEAMSVKTLGSYHVLVHLQGHSERVAPKTRKDLLPGVAVRKDPEISIALRCFDARKPASDKGYLFDFEIIDRLNKLRAALNVLEKAGAKTCLVVNVDACWAEEFFDLWRGADAKAAPPGKNVFVAWSAARGVNSEVITTSDGGAMTPWTRGFTKGSSSTSVQEAHAEATRDANETRAKLPEKTPAHGVTTVVQGAGHAQGPGSDVVKPGEVGDDLKR